MTREEAVIVLQNCAFMLHDGTRFFKPEHVQEFREAYEMAIKALEQSEPCEDAVRAAYKHGKSKGVKKGLGKQRWIPCDWCAYNPPSSMDGKPCTTCPAVPERR